MYDVDILIQNNKELLLKYKIIKKQKFLGIQSDVLIYSYKPHERIRV